VSLGATECRFIGRCTKQPSPERRTKMNGFKQVLLRGNVVDSAVGVVIGTAFGAVVTALVKDLLTPLIGAP